MTLLFPAILFLFWACGCLLLWHIPLLKRKDPSRGKASTVSIIIPARNEEQNLPLLLESLSLQRPRPTEVIVVDDHSEDGTAAVAAQKGVRLISSKPLPQGWLGKPWACWQAANAAVGELLLFLDADTRLEEGSLAKLMSACKTQGGLITVQPFHHMQRAYERLSAIFNIVTMAGTNAFTPLGRRLRPAVAFGPCMICSRQDYFEVGGHEVVQDQVLESIPLGKAFVEKDKPLHCYGGKESVGFRMYPQGFSSLFEGFSKGFATGAKATSVTALLMAIAWIWGGVSTTRHLVEAVVMWQAPEAYLFFALYVLYVVQTHWMLRRIGNFGFLTALLYPIPLAFFISVFFWSLFLTRIFRQTRWKGREVALGQRRADP